MKRISENKDFPSERKIYCNIIISNSMDKLLYRMITLNNGQKPMSARHQIEILASNLFDFNNLPLLAVSEKEARKKKISDEYINKDVIIKGYLAYISRSINIDNQKIIENKMNELIADKIMDSDIPVKKGEFKDVINFIQKMLKNKIKKDLKKISIKDKKVEVLFNLPQENTFAGYYTETDNKNGIVTIDMYKFINEGIREKKILYNGLVDIDLSPYSHVREVNIRYH